MREEVAEKQRIGHARQQRLGEADEDLLVDVGRQGHAQEGQPGLAALPHQERIVIVYSGTGQNRERTRTGISNSRGCSTIYSIAGHAVLDDFVGFAIAREPSGASNWVLQ